MERMLWTFDLDDTLRETQEPEYDAIRFAAADWYAEEEEELVTFMKEQSDQSSALYTAWQEQGKSPTDWTRFPLATANAYQKLVDDPDELETGIAYGIGFGAFGNKDYLEKHGMIDGAEATLEALADAGDDIVLITTGDEWIQQRKIDALGLADCCDDVYIVDDKAGAIKAAMATFDADPDETYHVGNSPRSDGKAAEKAGVGWVHVTGGTWRQDEVDAPVSSDYRVDSVDGLQEFHPELV